jgi:butyryl-CoA dehydrogenase
VQLSATPHGDEYVLSGRKIYVTNGAAAGLVIIFARTDSSAGNKGLSAFIVEAERPGFRVASVMRTLGVCAAGVAELVLDDVRIPKANLLGELGNGYKQALMLLDDGRIGIAAQAVGIAQAAFDAALAYAQQRQQFGHPIADFQAIQWMLAEMATELEAARLLTYQAAARRMCGKRVTKEASMAKLFASRTAVDVTNRAVQIHGGVGYMQDYPIQRYYRDARVTEIYEGTSEVQRLVIINQLLNPNK